MEKQEKNLNPYEYAVLICSHNGNKKLPIVIKSLIYSDLPPTNIYIVGTSKKDCIELKNKNLLNSNIKFILSPIANQVTQRLIGLTHIKEEIILQADDDLEFKSNCTKNLYNFLLKNDNTIVSPLVITKNNEPCCKRWIKLYDNSIVYRTYLKLLGWEIKYSNPQTILKNGAVIPMVKIPKEALSVDWICSTRMYRKKDIEGIYYILNNGKSWFEDVLSSIELKIKNNKKLYLLPSATIYQDINKTISIMDHIKLSRIQLSIADKVNGSKILAIIDIVGTIFIKSIMRIRKIKKL